MMSPSAAMRTSATRALMSLRRPSARRQPRASQTASAMARRVGRLSASRRMTLSSAVVKAGPAAVDGAGRARSRSWWLVLAAGGQAGLAGDGDVPGQQGFQRPVSLRWRRRPAGRRPGRRGGCARRSGRCPGWPGRGRPAPRPTASRIRRSSCARRRAPLAAAPASRPASAITGAVTLAVVPLGGRVFLTRGAEQHPAQRDHPLLQHGQLLPLGFSRPGQRRVLRRPAASPQPPRTPRANTTMPPHRRPAGSKLARASRQG